MIKDINTDEFFEFSEMQDSSTYLTIPKRSHWNLLRNVVKAISLFRNQEIKTYDDIDELLAEIKRLPTNEEYKESQETQLECSPFQIAINDLRNQDKFFSAVERGNSEDLKAISEYIANDPYRYLRLPNHPFSIVNKRNRFGHTPLYIACKNANYDVVELLLKNNADPLITSKVEESYENCLDVAVRWRHVKIVELLLTKEWPRDIIQRAIDKCTQEKIKAMLKTKIKKTKNKGKCFCVK
ncbi:unnamed protein product [Blepharisma stoltei]|uniref:Ankyrin repeat domain-containing protein n=1 Tax=Blepharisma stoltei TaxID=1481888 RepID=A0AAU9K3J3_9CILI|nr:unnamed protein product [Blepharisma stoltei]